MGYRHENAWKNGQNLVETKRPEERANAHPGLDMKPDVGGPVMPDCTGNIGSCESASKNTATQKVTVASIPRGRDEQLLEWLDLHENHGWTFADISRLSGVGRGSVCRAIRAILAECDA